MDKRKVGFEKRGRTRKREVAEEKKKEYCLTFATCPEDGDIYNLTERGIKLRESEK